MSGNYIVGDLSPARLGFPSSGQVFGGQMVSILERFKTSPLI